MNNRINVNIKINLNQISNKIFKKYSEIDNLIQKK